MNQIKVNQQQSINALAQQGWSRRRIERELGLDRETVAKYLAQEPKPATNPQTGSEAVNEAKPASNPQPGSGSVPGPPKGQPITRCALAQWSRTGFAAAL